MPRSTKPARAPDISAEREAEIRAFASGVWPNGDAKIPAGVPSFTRDLLAMLDHERAASASPRMRNRSHNERHPGNQVAACEERHPRRGRCMRAMGHRDDCLFPRLVASDD